MVFKNIFNFLCIKDSRISHPNPPALLILKKKKKTRIVYNLAVKCCPQQPPKLQTEEHFFLDVWVPLESFHC